MVTTTNSLPYCHTDLLTVDPVNLEDGGPWSVSPISKRSCWLCFLSKFVFFFSIRNMSNLLFFKLSVRTTCKTTICENIHLELILPFSQRPTLCTHTCPKLELSKVVWSVFEVRESETESDLRGCLFELHLLLVCKLLFLIVFVSSLERVVEGGCPGCSLICAECDNAKYPWSPCI